MTVMAEQDGLVKVVLAVRDGLTHIVEELNHVLEEMAPGEVGVPNIDLGELDQAGWATYQTKTPAEPGKAAWIKNPVHFTDFKAPPVVLELVKALKRSPKERLQLGDVEYFFSGEGKFISRRPKKVEK